MSTRANILLTDGDDTLFFYRHSDGYPDGAMPVLERFMDAVKAGKIRDNISQAGGWLIVLGQLEYNNTWEDMLSGKDNFYGWKVGSIEPTTCIHGDVEYIYTVDLANKTITVSTPDMEDDL